MIKNNTTSASKKILTDNNINDIRKFAKSSTQSQRVYINLNLNKNSCKEHDLKYFKLISLNLTEQSIQNNIASNSASNNLFSVNVLNDSNQFDISNIVNNNDIFLSDISLSSDTTKTIIEKYSIRNTLVLKQLIDLDNLPDGEFNISLYFKVANSKKNENYNFMIYCYNSKNSLIEKSIIENINLGSIDIEQFIDFDNIINQLYNSSIKNNNLFFINSDPELNLKNRNLYLSVGRHLMIYRDNIEEIFSSIYVQEITNKKRTFIKQIKLDEIKNINEKLVLTFQEYLQHNEFPLKYILQCSLRNGKYFETSISNFKDFKIKRNSENFNFFEKIKKDILKIETQITNIQQEKYLTIEIKTNPDFSINVNQQYDPYLSGVYINNGKKSLPLPLSQFLINSNNDKAKDSDALKLKNIKDKIIKINVQNIQRNIDISNLSNFSAQIEFSNIKENTPQIFTFEKNISNMQNLNLVNLRRISTNNNLNILDQYTFENYQYSFNNIFSISNQSSDLLSNTSTNIVNQYNTLNFDKILSNENKNILLKDININNLYLIIKKNIACSNHNFHSFEIVDIGDDIYNFTFSDNTSFLNFLDNSKRYPQGIDIVEKNINFEAKIMSLPLEYFSNKYTPYQIKLKIKDIIRSNKNNQETPTQQTIDKVYNNLLTLNNNGIKNLNQNNIEELYNEFALMTTYARSDVRNIEKKEEIFETRTGNITINLSDVSYHSKDTLLFSIDINKDIEIEEINFINIIKELIEEKLFLGFFYKSENSNYPDKSLDSDLLYSNNIPTYFLPWFSNDSNNIVNEVNSHYSINIFKKQTNFYLVEVLIDLMKCNNLYNFLILVQNKKDKVSKENNLIERLYQKINIKDVNKNYIDKAGENIHLIFNVRNKDMQFIKYPIIKLI